jgi:hypothetical protein
MKQGWHALLFTVRLKSDAKAAKPPFGRFGYFLSTTGSKSKGLVGFFADSRGKCQVTEARILSLMRAFSQSCWRTRTDSIHFAHSVFRHLSVPLCWLPAVSNIRVCQPV